MSLRPNSEKDGPVTVYTTDGDQMRFDRIQHCQSGMVTLYDVERVGRDNGGIQKGERAKTLPVRMIEEIEYEGYGE